MDRLDRRLLNALQQDSSASIAQLADMVGLSASACHRRMRALEEAGIIRSYGARLDPAKLGIGLHVLIDITLVSQSSESMERFERAVSDFPDILECHLLSGTADYRLRTAARDMADYDRLHRETLARLPGVSTMHTSFVIRTVKAWNGYALV
jgi:Lrp/AsnC family leucine-responsive transcriptional regulator